MAYPVLGSSTHYMSVATAIDLAKPFNHRLDTLPVVDYTMKVGAGRVETDDATGKNTWGTLAALLGLWEANSVSHPRLPADIDMSLHKHLGHCERCGCAVAMPAVLVRGCRIYRSDAKSQCSYCVPHLAPTVASVAEGSKGQLPRAFVKSSLWQELPMESISDAVACTSRLVLFPCISQSLLDVVFQSAPIREVMIRHAASLYDVGNWMSHRIVRLSLHTVEGLHDGLMLRLLGHVQSLESLHLIHCCVTESSLIALAPELPSLQELVIADCPIRLRAVGNLTASPLRSLVFQEVSSTCGLEELQSILRAQQKSLNDVFGILPLLEHVRIISGDLKARWIPDFVATFQSVHVPKHTHLTWVFLIKSGSIVHIHQPHDGRIILWSRRVLSHQARLIANPNVFPNRVVDSSQSDSDDDRRTA